MTMRPLATGCLIAAGWLVGTSVLRSVDSSGGQHSYKNPEPFRLSTYPDSPTLPECRHVKTPRLCDPDGVLKESTTFLLDDRLESRNVTLTKGKNRGVVVPVQYGVAVMRKMDLTTSDVDDAMDTLYDVPEQAAEIFARHIHDAWGVGTNTETDGGTGVLIFLSVEDRTVYFSRGQALDRVLRDRRVDAIIETIKPLLRQWKYDQAIVSAIDELDHYLAAGPRVDWSEWFTNWSETISVVLVFVVVGLFIRKDIVDRRHYARVSTQLSELDRARAEALQGTFKATSCPICLENFKKKRECTVIHEHGGGGESAAAAALSSAESPQSEPLVGSMDGPAVVDDVSPVADDELVGSDGLPLKLLRCGHTFDETCWQEWINNGNSHSIHKCPICQQDVGEKPDSTSVSSSIVDPLSIPRGGAQDNVHNSQTTMLRRQDNNNNNNEDENSTEAFRRELRSLALRQYTQERNFRLMRMAERFPQYIQRNELQRWTQVSYNGSLAQDSQLARQAAAEASMKRSSSWGVGNSSSIGSSGFGGGFSSGGRGGRW